MLSAKNLCALCAILISVFSSSPLFAQSGPALLIKPWPKEQFIENSTDMLFFADTTEEDNGREFTLNIVESLGRIRLLPGNIASPRIGYELTYLDIGGEDGRLPKRLTDQSLGAGFAFAKVDDWIAGATIGAGYAGDTPYGDAQGWYGKATVILFREINENHSLGFAIDYDGNRTMLPDVPLPGIQYSFKLPQRNLQLVVGAPINAVIWDVNPRTKVEATWTMLDRFDGRASYLLARHISLFGRFESRQIAFRMDEFDDTNDRLLWQQRRVEAGIYWSPYKFLKVMAAGGWAFGQDFSVGFDFRRDWKLADIDDAPYGRFGIEFRF